MRTDVLHDRGLALYRRVGLPPVFPAVSGNSKGAGQIAARRGRQHSSAFPWRPVILPAETQVHGEISRCLPIVLHEQRAFMLMPDALLCRRGRQVFEGIEAVHVLDPVELSHVPNRAGLEQKQVLEIGQITRLKVIRVCSISIIRITVQQGLKITVRVTAAGGRRYSDWYQACAAGESGE